MSYHYWADGLAKDQIEYLGKKNADPYYGEAEIQLSKDAKALVIHYLEKIGEHRVVSVEVMSTFRPKEDFIWLTIKVQSLRSPQDNIEKGES